jgi:hypothetical protein
MKRRLAAKRIQIGDTGADYPEIEGVIQQFWDYGPAARAQSAKISNQFLQHRKMELKESRK